MDTFDSTIPPFSQETAEAFRAEVEAGGVYFWCETCGAQGAIAARSPWSAQVRAMLNVPAPEHIGVCLDKNDCPDCNTVRH